MKANESEVAYGRSLPQRYYADTTIFANDLRFLGATQWLLAGPEARIPHPGDHFCVMHGERMVTVTRAVDGEIRLRPESVGLVGHGCAAARLKVCSGFIFVCFGGHLTSADEPAPDFEYFMGRLRPYLAPHGFEECKVARRVVYPTAANWKLIVENFLECYHCGPAHPTYCSVHSADKLLAFGAGPGSSTAELGAGFARQFERWENMARAKGFLTGMFADDPENRHFQAASRVPVGDGYLTESFGGKPVAPLMGRYAEYDHAQTAVTFNPLGHVIASSDHAVMFRFVPRGAMSTDVEAQWLVRADAVAGRDYDPDSLITLWDVTLREDKTITENNQAGVLSKHYAPGPHSQHEKRISDFVAWYARHA